MPLAHIHGSKSSLHAGVPSHTWYLCSSGTKYDVTRCRIYTHGAIYSLATNIIVSSMLILGGSATVTSLTGMNTIAVSERTPPNIYQS